MNDLPIEVSGVVGAWMDRLRHILGGDLAGVYLYGALVFPDSHEYVQDIDFHVFVRRPFDDERRREIVQIRPDLVREFGRWAEEMDGYYILLEDARSVAPPRHQLWPISRVPVDAAWALHCAHIHAGRFLSLVGPDPRQVYPVPSWPDLRAALFGEAIFIDQHLTEAPACAILNAIRILYSFTTQDVVVSKHAAALWGLTALPARWQGTIRAALRSYRGEGTAEEQAQLQADTRPFVDHVWDTVGILRAAQ